MSSPFGDESAPDLNAPAAAPRPSWEVAPQPARRPAPPADRPAPRPAPLAAPVTQAEAPLPHYASPSHYAPPPQYAAAPQAGYPRPALDAPPVQYDLAGNPVASATPTPSPYAQPHAVGIWPPPPTSLGGRQSIGEGTDRVSRLKWNWGAFLIPFWWSLFNGQKNVAIIIFVTNIGSRYIPAPFDWLVVIGQLGLQIYLGVMGHRLAWASDRFGGDYDHYVRTQRAWMIWGFALAGLIGVGLILLIAIVPGVLSVLAGGSQPVHHVTPYGGSGAGSP